MENQKVNKIDLEKHFNNVVVAVEAYRGTKQEHINLEIALSIIKTELFKDEKNTIDGDVPPTV